MKIFQALFFCALVTVAAFGTWVYAGSPLFSVHAATQEKTVNLLPQAAFTITFSAPITRDAFLEAIRISPSHGVHARIGSDHHTLILTPDTPWQPDTTYAVHIPAGRIHDFRPLYSSTHTFHTAPTPQVAQARPTSGRQDVIVDIEDPIVVTFNRTTRGFTPLFTLTPAVPLASQNDASHTIFELLPEQPLASGTQYTLTVSVVPEGVEVSVGDVPPAFTTHFTTLPQAPATWAQDLDERLEQATLYIQPRISAGKYIDINLTSQVMTLFEDGQQIGNYMISSGKSGMNTPRGTHQIYNKAPRPWSKKYGLYMPYWMAITPDGAYGIHELPEWPGGYKEGANHLGIPVSHGCVRLGVGPAQRIYEWAEVGTPVIVY